MKKTLLIALLLLPFWGFTQTKKPITSFLGIKFGSSRAQILAAMQAKGYAPNKKYSNAENLAYNNVRLGHRPCAFVVKFVNNKAFEADYISITDPQAKCIHDYNEIVDQITGIYGEGQVTKNYSSPYTEGDDNTLTGLSDGKIDLHTLWIDSDNNTIQISIDSNLDVNIVYQNGKLVEEAIANQHKKDASDF